MSWPEAFMMAVLCICVAAIAIAAVNGEVRPMSDLAERIARRIFELGDEPESPCQRLEFKGGSYALQRERSQGGLCEEALANTIRRVLEEEPPHE